jgi:OmpA-OmpF porin, OOP family
MNNITRVLLGTATLALAISGCSTTSKTAAAPAAPAPVAAAPAAAPAVVVAPLVIPAPKPIVIGDVNFEFNKATFTPMAEGMLSEMTQTLRSQPNTVYQVNGYADSQGSSAYNLGLSERRANAVRDYQIEQGIPASQMIASGFGESNPVATNSTRDGRAMNRRVEMRPVG